MSWEPSEAFYEWVRKNSRASAAKEWETTGSAVFIALLENLLSKVRSGEDFDKELETLYYSQVFGSWREKQPKERRTSTGWH